MAETWVHPSMPGLIVHPADFQALGRVRRIFPDITSPLQKAAYFWEGSEEVSLHPPVGFPMAPGEISAPAFSLDTHPWIGTFPLHAWGRGDIGLAHSTPAFVVQVKFFWKRLQSWTNGPLPSTLYDLLIGAVDVLWGTRASQANEQIQAILNANVASPT